MVLALDNFLSSVVFDEIAAGLEADSEFVAYAVKELGEIFAIEIANAAKEHSIWTVDFKQNGAVVRWADGLTPEYAGVTLALSDENWGKLVAGTSSAPKLYLLNKLKLKGSLAKARKFNIILNELKEKTNGERAEKDILQ